MVVPPLVNTSTFCSPVLREEVDSSASFGLSIMEPLPLSFREQPDGGQAESCQTTPRINSFP
ncbi:hypothetical protein Ciccas_012253, partial [Cichlidogyrus casuarinus]